MKILYVCHRFPFPPKRGGKIRPFNMIRHLSARHEVHVASIARSIQEAQEGEGLAAHCASYDIGRVSNPVQTIRMLLRLPTATPSSIGYFHSPQLAQRIDALGGLSGALEPVFVGKPIQHHRGRQDHCGGVGLALPHDIGRGAVAGLEYGVAVADIG